jgi:hypothetical protein
MAVSFSFVLSNPLYSVHFNEHFITVLIYNSTVFSLIHIGKKTVLLYIGLVFFAPCIYQYSFFIEAPMGQW